MSNSVAHQPLESYFIKLITLLTLLFYFTFLLLLGYFNYFIYFTFLLTTFITLTKNLHERIKLFLLNYFINLFVDFKSLNLYLTS